ncbi:MAG: ImmA/IrrE family metallo-endopeptidase [Clostridia bacterium]|nr:ImmA/IrrE family metallo-endopeptidase [Clostridia bacterium]
MVSELKKRFNTSDPFDICSYLNILVRFRDLGSVKGLYKYYKRNRFIIVNSCLDYDEQRVVCAHELAHDRLHGRLVRNAYMFDNSIDDFSLKPEFEANVFASELLIDDDYIIKNYNSSVTFSDLASSIGVCEALVRIKCAILKNRGADIDVRTDFDYNIFR